MTEPDQGEATAEVVIAGEATGDGNVALHADLVGDWRHGTVTVKPVRDRSGGPSLIDVRLTDGLLRNVNLERTRFTEAVLEDADIWAWGPNLSPPIDGLRINGIEIAPLFEAE